MNCPHQELFSCEDCIRHRLREAPAPEYPGVYERLRAAEERARKAEAELTEERKRRQIADELNGILIRKKHEAALSMRSRAAEVVRHSGDYSEHGWKDGELVTLSKSARLAAAIEALPLEEENK